MSDIILPFGAQADGSIIDVYGNRMLNDERLQIIEQVAGLPATAMRDDIVRAVGDNVVTIVDGETGSGKTTQIGKMLFDPKKQIVITQPRVLSAMSNANRVSRELLAETMDSRYSLGHRVGYRTGRGVSSSRTSPLSFNTDGLELMRLAYSGLVPDILVLDEVHNFAIPTEMIAMLMKYKKDIKIIIMSATLDSGVFQEYFNHISSDIPVIKIPGRTHPVAKNLLGADNYMDIVADQYHQGKNILFFVPGKREIEDEIALLRAKFGPDAEIFPLHADLPKEEQQKLLTKDGINLNWSLAKKQDGSVQIQTDAMVQDFMEQAGKRGKPRIIVSTNVAEESITIPYIDVVIDKGNHKVARFNHHGIQELRLENTSRANCFQRAGRAGRTKPGEYFRVNDTSFDELDEYPEAPMEREMLDKYILILLANDISIEKLHEEEMLNDRQLFFHSFNTRLLELSYKRLAQIGAIDRMKNITPLGRDLLKFPLEIYHARMLREAIKRKCVEDMIYITAILEKKGFVSKDEEWKQIKMLGAKDSDLFGYTDLFKLLTAKTLPSSKIELLFELGIDRDELNDFVDRGGEYKLYELVNLDPIGIKNKKIKEIDELVANITKRLTDSGIEITSSPSMSDKKICLASGSLHNVYKYDPKNKMFHNREAKINKSTLYFKAGNVTLVEPTSHHFYLGQPFIIGGGEFSSDLNLLTFLTQVDEGHIHDAKLSTQSLIGRHAKTTEEKGKDSARRGKSVHDMNRRELTALGASFVPPFEKGGTIVGEGIQKELPHAEKGYEQIFQDGTKISGSDQEIRNQARLVEKCSKSESRNNFFQTQEDARMYYLRYRLPDFLVENNARIRKYLADKSEDDIFTFKELLVRFILEDEAYRINVTTLASIAKTEKSFRHDSIIFDRFLESTDPFIQAFRKGKKITLPSEDRELIIGTSDHEDEEILMENREVRELQNQYARLLGSVKHIMKRVDEDRIKAEILREFFLQLELYSEEYKSLKSTYHDLGKMEMSDVKKRGARLKGVERNTKVLQKTQHKKENIEETIEKIRDLINGNKEMDIQFFFKYEFGEDVSDRYVEKYYNALRLIQSSDTRQRQRGADYLESVIMDLNNEVLKLDKEIVSLTEETDLSNVPEALDIQNAIESICKNFFDKEYYDVMVAGKILNVTREVLRDQVTENKGFHNILVQFLDSLKIGHVKSRKEFFDSVEQYTDTVNELEIYASSIYREVKETRDTEKLQSRIRELQGKVEALYLRKEVLVKSEVMFL